MAFVIADRVRETTNSTGTGAVTLAGAYISFQTFLAAIGNGNTTYYTIASAATGEWEVGIGTYSSGPNTLSRDTILASSNGGAAVNFIAGSKDVFVTQPSERSLLLNSSSNGLVAGNAAFTAGDLLYATSTTAVSNLAIGALNTVLTSTGSAPQWSNSLSLSTLTTSSTVTLNGGTTNGVAYLNGSKVLTTGSALTFDGTNLSAGNASQNLGTTTARWGTVYATALSDGTDQLVGSSGAVARFGYGAAWTDQSFAIGGSEAMRLTSTGLGIGTSSPGAKLDVNGQVRAAFASGFQVDNAGTMLGKLYYSGGLILDRVASSSLLFQQNSSTQAALDSSGNLGLGVTPNAWSASAKAIQFGAFGAVYQNASGYPEIAFNTYQNASNTYTYRNTDVATRYSQTNGQHRWFTAPSGTAGNAISFTQALTLDANRNLLLNGTSAGASAVGTFAIFNGTAPTGSVTNGIILYAEDVSSSSELKVRDEAGNVTTLSPHNFSLIPEGPSEDMAWAYYSEKGNKRINVDMLKLARMVEKLTGEKLVYES